MRSPMQFLRGVQHPEAYHGDGRTKAYFEGWYVKLVSADQAQRWAVIPGVFKGIAIGDSAQRQSQDEAFVQILDGLTGRSWFHRFDVSEFRAADDTFDVWVGDNHFCSAGASLALPQLSGEVQYSTKLRPWPVTLASPGIMGWYGLVPFMECFHGIVSFGHALEGTLAIEGKSHDMRGGRGYIEKDWGKGFPSGYVWLHSNHIDFGAHTSLIASAAIIPWLGRSFRGFIIGLMHEGRLYKWTTYNGSRELTLAVDDTKLHWKVTGPDGELEIKALRARGGLLHAPLHRDMHRRVEETMDSTVELTLRDAKGSVVTQGTGICAALEIFGELERLLAYK
jgi:tocopherol cyclase